MRSSNDQFRDQRSTLRLSRGPRIEGREKVDLPPLFDIPKVLDVRPVQKKRIQPERKVRTVLQPGPHKRYELLYHGAFDETACDMICANHYLHCKEISLSGLDRSMTLRLTQSEDVPYEAYQLLLGLAKILDEHGKLVSVY